MIFVTIGTMYGFPRLIKEIDEIAKNINEEIIMQIGETIYEPKNAKFFRFASREEMKKLYKNSRIVVSHAGVGSILSAIENKKPIIVVPRMKEYGEIIDDHQFEITKELEKEGTIVAIYDTNELRVILNGRINLINNGIIKDNTLAIKLKEYLNKLERKN